jgi:hypothetical protein
MLGLRGGDPRAPLFALLNHSVFGLGLGLATSSSRAWPGQG